MSKIKWTDEIQDVFETYLGMEENLTFEEIAKRMSQVFTPLKFTKNACVGRAHRARLPPRPAKLRKSKGKMMPMPIRIDAPILPLEAQRTPNGHDLTIYQLHAGDCRYPSEGDRPPYTYCGHATRNGLPYCPDHCKIVYQTPKQR